MTNHTIAFVGGGNMARSLVGGLVGGGWPATHIRISDPDHAQLDLLSERFAVTTTPDNDAAVDGADIVVLAVKPQMMMAVATGLAHALRARNPLVISIAAGIRVADLTRWLGGEPALVRCMPNTPALIKSGATGLYANARVSSVQRELAESILQTAGITVWFDDEAQLDTVTALSGSGPAYFLLVMEALEEAGAALGLPREAARALTLQTALGAARLAQESGEDPATLRRRVTSKGGTTERAIQHLESQRVRETFKQAVEYAAQRSRELAQESAPNETDN